jgi:hypothetical protein
MAGKIVYNKEEQTFLDSLSVGECGAVNVKRIKDNTETNEKWFSIELAERIAGGSSSFNALAFMNPRDGRFSQSGGPRRQWLNGSADMIIQVLPNISQAELDSLQLGVGRVNALVKHPKAGSENRRFQLQIVGMLESNMDSTSWELKPENYDRAKKTAGSGPNARDIKGVNTETGAIEQIFERMVVRTAVKDAEGNWTNEGGWEHEPIAEYVAVEEMSTPPAVEQVFNAVPTLD